MNKSHISQIVPASKSYKSKAGYVIREDDDHWILSKNTKTAVGAVRTLLAEDVWFGYIRTLAFYAGKYSAGHTKNINERFLHFLRTENVSEVHENALINYKSTLSREHEWYLGTIKGFLYKWHALGHYGVSNKVVELLDGWSLKGNIKGDVVKRLDPLNGPLSDLELQGFNEGVVQAYEKNNLSVADMALGLLTSNVGRRPIQISNLKIKDVLTGKNKKKELVYIINIPRAKQRGVAFRGEFKQFAITYELWVILTSQVLAVKKDVGNLLPYELQDVDQLELPLFPDMKAISQVASPRELRQLLQTDRLHISSTDVTTALKHCGKMANIRSERTGDLLHITAYRFRYTTGTRAAREGFGIMVIAELLDHSDIQNASVYIENIPEHVEKLDQAVGHQMAHYAQAFAGILVDVEKDAKRGNDINSRVSIRGKGAGTCGSHGFCGANVPIPCYTCMHFQPWLDGPHQIVYDELIAERERLLEVTGDMQIAAVNDRSIIAVANVIQLCVKRREELANG